MTKIEKFNLISAIVGLFVNLVTVLGILTGFLGASTDISFISSAPALMIITFFSLLYFVLSLKFYLSLRAKKRWTDLAVAPSYSHREVAVTIFFYLTWTPLFCLWCVAMAQLWVNDPRIFPQEFFVIAGLIGGGFGPFLLAHAFVSFDTYLDPDWYNH